MEILEDANMYPDDFIAWNESENATLEHRKLYKSIMNSNYNKKPHSMQSFKINI